MKKLQKAHNSWFGRAQPNARLSALPSPTEVRDFLPARSPFHRLSARAPTRQQKFEADRRRRLSSWTGKTAGKIVSIVYEKAKEKLAQRRQEKQEAERVQTEELARAREKRAELKRAEQEPIDIDVERVEYR